MAEIRRQPQSLTAKVQAQHGHLTLDALMVPLSVTALLDAVEAQAELVLVAEPTANVYRPPYLTVRHVAAGELSERLVSRALGHHVDAAADTASRRDPVDQLAGAFDDVDAVGHFHVDRVGRQYAVQTVVGNVAVKQAETADGELLEASASRVGRPYRRVAGDQVAEGPRLLVLHRLTGVGGHAERRFHEVPRAQQTLRATPGDLPTGIALAVQVAPGVAAEDAGRRDFQGIRPHWQRHQGVGTGTDRLQLQTTALQQPGEAFINAVVTRQAGAAPATDQARLHRNAHPGLACKADQGRAEVAGRHLVAALLTVGHGHLRRQRAEAEHQAQAQGGTGKRRRRGRSATCQCGHCCAL
ncbi:hypothetical protein D3C81_720100 [compost metagenome]